MTSPALRRLLALLAILALLAVATVWWTGRQGARLPGWYLEAAAAGRLEPDLEAAARRAQQGLVGRFGRELLDEVTADDGTPDESFLDRIKRRGKIVLEGLREGRQVRLEPHDLEDLVLAIAYGSDDGRELLAATRAVRAEIVGAELELGAVITPARLPAHRLSAGRRRLLDLLLRLSGSDGEVYVAVRAVPAAVDDRLLLGPPVDLLLGELELGSRLLSALGVAAPELESGLTLDVGRVKVRQATIEGETLVLVVSPEI
jgi:hypothetical protein